VGFEPISSRRNPLVKGMRDLHNAAGRVQQQRLLLEGTHLLQEALRLGRPPDLLLATANWMASHPELLMALPPSTVCREASTEVIEAAATTRHPDGVVGTLPWALPENLLPRSAPDFGLLLDNVQDPGNLGTLLRTALAARVDQIWLVEGADPWQPKVLRSSSGASLALPIGRFTRGELPGLLKRAKAAGTRLMGTVVEGGAPYWSQDWKRRILLMLGNEGAGLGPELLAHADALLTIPLSGGVESLNVAVAAAPLLLERRRQQLGAGASAQMPGP
jgi:TrmH family RNA methyltransferase